MIIRRNMTWKWPELRQTLPSNDHACHMPYWIFAFQSAQKLPTLPISADVASLGTKNQLGKMPMRKVVIGVIGSLTMCIFEPAAFAADGNLVDNEITMTIYAKGVAHSAPDKITISHEFSESGNDEVSARAALNAHLDTVRKKLSALGAGTYSVDFGEINISKQASLADMMQAAAASKPSGPSNSLSGNPVHAKASIKVVFHDITKLSSVKSALEADDSPASWMLNGSNPFQSPFALTDDTKARSAAVSDAIAKAKAEAELYTARMGYHIVRIKGFGNETQMYNMNDVSGMMSKVIPFFGSSAPDVTTDANIKIEFVVAPN